MMDANEPIRQEAAHAQAKKKQKSVFTAHVIVADAREPGEPQLFYFSLEDAPKHMQNQLKRNNSDIYEFLSNDDGVVSLMGLVNEESEEAEERAEEVWNYIDNKCNNENKFKPGIHRSIQYSFTLASV